MTKQIATRFCKHETNIFLFRQDKDSFVQIYLYEDETKIYNRLILL